MVSKIESALEEGLALLEQGLSLEGVLARFPEQAAELRPLLTASQPISGIKNLQPRPEFRARGRVVLQEQMRNKPRRRTSWFATQSFRFAASAAVLVLALLTTGTALAQRALPGDILYPWKLVSESFWHSLQKDKVAADLTLASRRQGELLAVMGNAQLESIGLSAYIGSLNKLKADVAAYPGSRQAISDVLISHRQSLSEIFAASGASLMDLDELFSLPETPTEDEAGEAPETEASPDLNIPLVVTPLPFKREDEPEDNQEGWLEQAIDSLLGLP